MAVAIPPVLLAASDPTTAYTATSWCKTSGARLIAVSLSFVKTDGTSFEWYYEWSEDASTWYREPNVANAAGTSTITVQENTFVAATAKIIDALYVIDNFFRVEVKRTGGAVTNTVAVNATLVF